MVNLKVSEIFGPTIQGEGPSAGKPAYFIRLGVCNLDCSWCDTKYTWDWQHYNPRIELKVMKPVDIMSRIVELAPEDQEPRLIVITGGEPMLQQAGITALMSAIFHVFGKVAIEFETNGTKLPPAPYTMVDASYNVSPKLAHSGIPLDKRYVPEVLKEYVSYQARTGRGCFKFVVKTPEDLEEIDTYFARPFQIPEELVWVMMEGVEQKWTEGMLDSVIRRGWNVSPRMHAQFWGDKRGK